MKALEARRDSLRVQEMELGVRKEMVREPVGKSAGADWPFGEP